MTKAMVRRVGSLWYGVITLNGLDVAWTLNGWHDRNVARLQSIVLRFDVEG